MEQDVFNPTLSKKISEFLVEEGVPDHLQGYRYLFLLIYYKVEKAPKNLTVQDICEDIAHEDGVAIYTIYNHIRSALAVVNGKRVEKGLEPYTPRTFMNTGENRSFMYKGL